MPEGAQTIITVPSGTTVLPGEALPEGWRWEDEGIDLVPGSIIRVNAIYEDTENYETYEVEITVYVSTEIILSASDLIYIIGVDTEATIKCSGALSQFKGVSVDGTTVSSDNYSLQEGSTIITFPKDYMDQLSPGEHTFTLFYTSGTVDSTVLVKDGRQETEETQQSESGNNSTEASTEAGTQSVRTGDDTPIALYLMLMLLAATCMAGTGVVWKRKRNVTR